MDKDFWISIKEELLSFLMEKGPDILYAIAALLLGIFFIRMLHRFLKSILRKTKLELSLQSFIESLGIFVLYGFLFFIIGSILGIKSSSFIGIFGAMAIAIGLALQGSLGNFAGGVLILVFKPFRVGDLIQVNSNLGFVQKIDILYTQIKAFDGRIITMPNGTVSNSDIDNRTKEKHRRIELIFKFSFDEDIDRLREIVLTTMNKHPDIEKELPVDFWLYEIGEYDMKFKARCWVDSNDHWPVYWQQLEAIKKALDANGIVIPVPKREISQMKNEREE